MDCVAGGSNAVSYLNAANQEEGEKSKNGKRTKQTEK